MANSESRRNIIKMSKSEDPFKIMRIIIFDFFDLPIIKLINVMCIIAQTLVLLLQIYYMYINFTLDLVQTYLAQTLVYLFVIIAIVCSLILQPTVTELLDFYFSTASSIRNVDLQRRSCVINKFNKQYNLQLFLLVCAVVVPPLTAFLIDLRELFLPIQLFEKYFGVWSKVMIILYFSMLPVLVYSTNRFCYLLLYALLHSELQHAIIGEYIFELSTSHPKLTDEMKRVDVDYQNSIRRGLKLIIEGHIFSKTILTKLINNIKQFLPVFVVAGTLTTSGIIVFCLWEWEKSNFGSRLLVTEVAASTIFIIFLYTEGGQRLTDQTGGIFVQISDWPWHVWNKENKQTLLTFMTNCLKPIEISFVGIVLNRRLLLSMINKTYSHVLVFYNMGIMN